MVTICCITYNHRKYIQDALDGFLRQKTNFPFEIIVNDDASTDGTTEILKEYQRQYPDIVFPILHQENQYSKGYRGLAARNIFPIARGRYFAMCEGDDYWTDSLKLQKQVDFLEKHPGCSCCYHPVRLTYANGIRPDRTEGPPVIGEVTFSSEVIIGGRFIRMVALMFRADVFKNIPTWIFSSPNGDIPIQLICASKGAVGYLGGKPMATYRRGVEGSWSEGSFGAKEVRVKWTKKWLQDNLKIYNLFNHNSGYKYNKLLQPRKRRVLVQALFLLQKLSGRPGIARLIVRHFGALLCFHESSVVKFWFRFIFGIQLSEMVCGKLRSVRKKSHQKPKGRSHRHTTGARFFAK